MSRRDELRSVVARSREVILLTAIVGRHHRCLGCRFRAPHRERDVRPRRESSPALAARLRAGGRARGRDPVAARPGARDLAVDGRRVHPVVPRRASPVVHLDVAPDGRCGRDARERWRDGTRRSVDLPRCHPRFRRAAPAHGAVARTRIASCCSSRARPRQASPRSSRRPPPARSSRSRCPTRTISPVACCCRRWSPARPGYLGLVAINGTTPLFPVHGAPPFSFADLGGAAALGIAAAIGARAFTWLLMRAEAHRHRRSARSCGSIAGGASMADPVRARTPAHR